MGSGQALAAAEADPAEAGPLIVQIEPAERILDVLENSSPPDETEV